MNVGKIIAGGAAAIAAGSAALVSMQSGAPAPGDAPALTAAGDLRQADDFEICLKRDLPLFEGVDARCYDRSALRALYDAAVVDGAAATVDLEMSHPTDYSAADRVISTCGQYREMQFDGWYAASARAMRREAYLMRACAVLAALNAAAPARETFFEGGSPTAAEIAALIETGEMTMGEAETETLVVRIVGDEDHFWRIETGAADITLEELANADFDGDGVEEILVFATIGAVDGAMRAPSPALLNKDSRDAALSLTPIHSDSETGPDLP